MIDVLINSVVEILSQCIAILLATQSYLTLWDSKDWSLPGFSVHGILQARTLECPFFRRSSWPRDQTRASHIAGRFFTVWATKEALSQCTHLSNHHIPFKNITVLFVMYTSTKLKKLINENIWISPCVRCSILWVNEVSFGKNWNYYYYLSLSSCINSRVLGRRHTFLRSSLHGLQARGWY